METLEFHERGCWALGIHVNQIIRHLVSAHLSEHAGRLWYVFWPRISLPAKLCLCFVSIQSAIDQSLLWPHLQIYSVWKACGYVLLRGLSYMLAFILCPQLFWIR